MDQRCTRSPVWKSGCGMDRLKFGRRRCRRRGGDCREGHCYYCQFHSGTTASKLLLECHSFVSSLAKPQAELVRRTQSELRNEEKRSTTAKAYLVAEVGRLMFELIYRFDPGRAETQRTPETWKEACRLLVQGNRDFAEMTDARSAERKTQVIPFDPRALGWGMEVAGVPAQVPFAAVLGCADARVPTEMIFSKGCNELFVVRVAGNVLGQECLGSLRYAVLHFPKTLKLLVVLAHAKCGAVT